jgi:hypothetical protein
MAALDDLSRTASWEWPSDAADRIRGALRSASEAERLAAVELASDLVVMDESLARQLLGMMERDAADTVRAGAALALGPALDEAHLIGFDEGLDPTYDAPAIGEACFTEVREALRRLYADARQPDSVRGACLQAAVRAPLGWEREEVEKAHASSNELWQTTAIACMGWLEGFEQELLAALEDPDERIQREAVRAAALAEVDAAGPRVLELARTARGDSDLRRAAVEALATLCPPGSDALLAELSRADDELGAVARSAIAERRAFSLPPPH